MKATPNGTTTTLEYARGYLSGGLSVIPIRRDGSKRPIVSWKRFETTRATETEIDGWYKHEDPPGIGIIAGEVSGGAEFLDFDEDAVRTFAKWKGLVEAEAPGLIEKLALNGTPRGGIHVGYRCSRITGNTKLAMRPVINKETGKGESAVLIESRGRGGYIIAPGSPAECHPSRRTYQHLGGPTFDCLPTITPDDREILWRCAAALDETPLDESTPSSVFTQNTGATNRPGDDFNARGPGWGEILEGWTLDHEDGGKQFWKRPGKSGPGWSATTGCRSKVGNELFCCFSHNAAPFLGAGSGRTCTTYTKFGAYATLHHAGDFAAAAKALAAKGYGEPRPQSTGSAAQPDDKPFREPIKWPAPLAAAAYHGLAGEVVRAIEPHSEIDPIALLVQILVGFGAALGRTAHFRVESDTHYLNEFVVAVGKSAKARKGTSWGYCRRILENADGQFAQERILSGLSSGEGLIWACRDAITKRQPIREKKRIVAYEEIEEDPGISDKRLLAFEPEFASVLRRIEGQQGNTLSAVLRQAWETGDLRTLTKNSSTKATGTHVSLIGHITCEELRRYLSATEQANGFGNRFCFFCVQRSKVLPEGGSLDPAVVESLGARVAGAMAFGRTGVELRRDDATRAVWAKVYPSLSEGKPGLVGCMLGRAEAHVMRFASIYAVLDGSRLIRVEHLQAALALWDYAEASVRYLFGDALGDPLADDLLRMLRSAGSTGMTRTELHACLSRHHNADRINHALGLLLEAGLARFERIQTAGRPSDRWFATGS